MQKFNNFVFCIFSFNRSAYLKNLIDSISEFYPNMQVVIFDDNSDEEELLKLYETLESNSAFTIVKPANQNGIKSKHGGVYNLMNIALHYCWEQDFYYAFFIQDDMQFVQYVDLYKYCEHYFTKWRNILMISPLFMQKIYLPKIDNYIEKKNGNYIFKNYGIADSGILHLKKAKEAKLVFNVRGERYNGEKYFALGYNLVLVFNPCLAWVPWAVSYKNKRKTGIFFQKRNSLFVKPVSDIKRKELLANTNLPFLEDFSKLNVWWIPKPYTYTSFNIKNIIMSYLNYWIFLLFRK